MQNEEYTVGQLISINNLVLEVCSVENYQCSNCAGFRKNSLCKKLPYCGNNFYYRKLNNFEIRKAKREKKIITEIF
ncbi:MAG: hypothetical protein EGP82_01925 [Odoribacter splanchnicus]|nr:hypothetical protein [Odoribacter splanchnicus]